MNKTLFVKGAYVQFTAGRHLGRRGVIVQTTPEVSEANVKLPNGIVFRAAFDDLLWIDYKGPKQYRVLGTI